MNFENSKIKEVIDDFHKIGALDASFFRRFIDKALLLLLNENEGDLDKYREDIISAIIQVLKKPESRNETTSHTFYVVHAQGKYTIQDTQPTEQELHKITADDDAVSSFVDKNKLSDLRNDNYAEIVALVITSLLLRHIKECGSKIPSLQSRDADISIPTATSAPRDTHLSPAPTDQIESPYKRLSAISNQFSYLCLSYLNSRSDIETRTWCRNTLSLIHVDVYGKLIWSILNAEYYKLDNFSDLLEDAINQNQYQYSLSEDRAIPYIFYSLRKLFERMIERCRVVDLMFSDDNESKDWIGVNVNTELGNWSHNRAGFDNAIYFENLITGLFDITDIDLVYLTTKDNIRKLIRVLKSIRDIDNRKNIFGETSNSTDTTFEKARHVIGTKARLLLHGMLSQKDNNNPIEVDYFIGDAEVEKDVSNEFTKQKVGTHNCWGNEFLSIWRNVKGCKFTISNFHIGDMPFYGGKQKTDIEKYNEFVKSAIVNDSRLSNVIAQLNNLSDIEIEESKYASVVTAIDSLSDCSDCKYTFSFLYRAIKFVFDKAPNGKISLEIANKLLDKLRRALDAYSDGNKPRYAFRPLFEKSFYQLNNDLQLEFVGDINTKSAFLFASLSLSPLNVLYFERFYNKYYSKSQHYANSQSLESMRLAEHTLLESKGERKHTIQLLGIFAAFLAFVTVSIGTIRVVKDVSEFVMFCSAFATSLLIFVLGIYYVAIYEKSKKEWYHVKLAEGRLLIAIILIGCLCALMVTKVLPKTKSDVPCNIEQKSDEINIYNHNPIQVAY